MVGLRPNHGNLPAVLVAVLVLVGCGKSLRKESQVTALPTVTTPFQDLPSPTPFPSPSVTPSPTPTPTPPPSPLAILTPVASGRGHSCAILPEGSIKCWGDNNNGQLGNNSTQGSLTPTPTSDLGGRGVRVAAAGNATVALLENGQVKRWGHREGLANILVPTTVAGLESGVSQIAVGFLFACAIQNGGLKCWGKNDSGQLGNGTTTPTDTPTQVLGLESGVTDVSLGDTTTCAIHLGVVKCWGDSPLGPPAISTPAPVPGLSGNDWTQVATGTQESCALRQGLVTCWGIRSGTRNPPALVAGLSGITDLKGSGHFCANNVAGALRCWRAGGSGQLGDGKFLNALENPVSVQGISLPITQFAIGLQSTIATTSTNLYTWGDNQYGQLGNGNTTNASLPVLIPLQ